MTKWVLLVAAVTVAGILIYITRTRSLNIAACKELVNVCEAAGFKLGPSPTQRRDFRNNCLRPILQTGSFNGKQFDTGTIALCKARFERRKPRAKNS